MAILRLRRVGNMQIISMDYQESTKSPFETCLHHTNRPLANCHLSLASCHALLSYAGSRIDFWTTFRKINSPISFPNGHIPRYDFVPNLSSLVGKVLLCGRNFPEARSEAPFTNLISRKRKKSFQMLLFGKETVKTFQIHGFRIMNSDRY